MWSKISLVFVTFIDFFSYRTLTAIRNIRISEGHAVSTFIVRVRRINEENIMEVV